MFNLFKKKIKTKKQVEVEEQGVCPNCGSTQWYEGPSGGMAVNIKCAGCGLWFNNTPFGLDFIYKHTLDPAKRIMWGYCEQCNRIYGFEFFYHADGKKYPLCVDCGNPLKVCWSSHKFPRERCLECGIRFKCYTEK
jgi:hypothetical protein